MSIAEKLLTIANNVPRVHLAGEKKHTARYAAALATGDGTNVISFDVPFEPDYISVMRHGADAEAAQYSVRQLTLDARSFARIGGLYMIRKDGSNSHGNFSSATAKNYFRWADGGCTVGVPAALGVPYVDGAEYICVAVKYTDKSDYELLCDEISLLADEGKALSYSSARVLGTVTEEEWQTLIAQKPSRDFTLG